MAVTARVKKPNLQDQTMLDGCPMFAPAYVGRKRRAKPIKRFYSFGQKHSKNSYSAHVRWCEHGAPIKSGLDPEVRFSR
jgi:hypothetical protein